jgi:hypothetical protein
MLSKTLVAYKEEIAVALLLLSLLLGGFFLIFCAKL